MRQIIAFFLRNKTFLLYLFLLFISIIFTIQSHSYHKSKFINSANFLSGGIYNSANNITQYFNLKHQNELLQEENNFLKSFLYNNENETSVDSSSFNGKYLFTSAHVIKNSYAITNNVITINKGIKDSIKQDFGVITSKGILGIIDDVSENYATVISILNTTSKISAQLKNTNHFGTLIWDAKSPDIIQLTEISKIAPLKKGDTIVTSGRSIIFPKGIPIGIIEGFKLDIAENFFTIDIKLFNDMTNLEHVYIIKNKDAQEINNLLNASDE